MRSRGLCGEALADERFDRFAHVLRLAAHAFFDLFTRARLVREKLEAGSAGANREQLAAKLEQARGYFTGAYADGPTLSQAEKDAVMWNTVRAMANLARLLLNRLDDRGV